jgi:hypothetical protein
MFHKHVKEYLSGYMDGELDPKRKKLVEDHLKSCKACQEELNSLQAIDRMTRSSRIPEPPEDYWKTLPGKIRSRIILEEEKGKPSSIKTLFFLRPPQLKWVSTFAVVILVLLVGRHFFIEERGAFLGKKSQKLDFSFPDEDEKLKAPEEGETGKLEDRNEEGFYTEKDSRKDLSPYGRQEGDKVISPRKKLSSTTELEEKGIGLRGAESFRDEDKITHDKPERSESPEIIPLGRESERSFSQPPAPEEEPKISGAQKPTTKKVEQKRAITEESRPPSPPKKKSKISDDRRQDESAGESRKAETKAQEPPSSKVAKDPQKKPKAGVSTIKPSEKSPSPAKKLMEKVLIEKSHLQESPKKTQPQKAPEQKTLPSASKKKAPSDADKYELAQIQQKSGKYADALKNYNLVIKENKKLAPNAQFQINLIQSETRDKASDEKSLRRKTEMWSSFIKTYPKSELIPEAHRHFADNAYALSKNTQKSKDIKQALDATEKYIQYLKGKKSAKYYYHQKSELEIELKKK